jgi:hypothetical protein
MTTISQRNTGSVWDKRARYIEQSTSALQRYVAMGDTAARNTKMREYTPQQAREADISLYSRLLSDEQRTGPGKMPERSSSTAHTSETTGWGKKHLAISGVSLQPYVQTAHHAGAIGPGGSGVQDNGRGSHMNTIDAWDVFETLRQQDTAGPSGSQFQSPTFHGFNIHHATDPYNSPSPLHKSENKGYVEHPPGTPINFKTKKTKSGRISKPATNPHRMR